MKTTVTRVEIKNDFRGTRFCIEGETGNPIPASIKFNEIPSAMQEAILSWVGMTDRPVVVNVSVKEFE